MSAAELDARDCPACQGTGADDDLMLCGSCDGTGERPHADPDRAYRASYGDA